MARRATAVLISGSGSNLRALLDAARDPAYPAVIRLVVSNRPEAFGLERARRAGVPAAVERGGEPVAESLDDPRIPGIYRGDDEERLFRPHAAGRRLRVQQQGSMDSVCNCGDCYIVRLPVARSLASAAWSR